MHICPQEVAVALAALPIIGYCVRCFKRAVQRWFSKKVA